MFEHFDKIQEEFDKLVPAILKMANEKKKISTTDQTLIDSGKNYIAALIVLVKLLGRKKAEKDNKYVFGSTYTDLINSFIFNCATRQEFLTYKEQRKAYSAENGNEVAPFVTVIGNLMNDSTDDVEILVTVCSFDFKIDSNSLIDGIDYCFQSFFALNIEFPVETRAAWVFLQKYVYKVDLKRMHNYQNVNTFFDTKRKRSSKNKKNADPNNDESFNATDNELFVSNQQIPMEED